MLKKRFLTYILISMLLVSMIPSMCFAIDELDEERLLNLQNYSFDFFKNTAVGEIRTGENDAVKRQPEVSSDSIANADRMRTYLNKSVSKAACYSIGKLGSNLLIAIARQPENRGNLSSSADYVANKIIAEKGKGDTEALALTMGLTSSSLMDSMARQPEYSAELFQASKGVFAEAKGKPYLSTFAYGELGESMMASMARQPEYINELNSCSKKVYSYINKVSTKTSYCSIGHISSGMLDSIARQPSANADISNAACEMYDIIVKQGKKAETEAVVLTLGKSGSEMLEAMARYPEASADITKAMYTMIDNIKGRPYDEGYSYGIICSSMMEEIKKPEEGKTEPEISINELLEKAVASLKEVQSGEYSDDDYRDDNKNRTGDRDSDSNTTNIVSFDMQGHGKEINSIKIETGTSLSFLPEPMELGYNFLGWYKEPECINTWDIDKDIVETDITLYAKWSNPFIKLTNYKALKHKAIKLNWNKIEGATKYIVYANKTGKKFKAIKIIDTTTYTVKRIADKKLIPGKKYKFCVVTYLGDQKIKSQIIKIKAKR